MTALTAQHFVERLAQHRSAAEQEKIQRYFKTGEGEYGEGDVFMGVRMGQVFALSTELEDLPLDEVEALLDSPIHEARAGALKIMARQAARKRATEAYRAALYELYLRRMDRIDTWDLADLAAWDVVGRHLADTRRDVLYDLARSDDVWARRTAILATMHFVRQGELDDTFALAEVLLDDPHDLIHKPVGGMLREAGKHDRPRLLRFLDQHAATMPRTALRYAIEHLDDEQRAHYLAAGKARAGR
jgi:3-methyladenine DNA glycosylase AlkD